jgi:hypothetical protein
MFDSPVVGSGSDVKDCLDAARNAFVSCVMGFAAPSTSGLVREKFCQKATSVSNGSSIPIERYNPRMSSRDAPWKPVGVGGLTVVVGGLTVTQFAFHHL